MHTKDLILEKEKTGASIDSYLLVYDLATLLEECERVLKITRCEVLQSYKSSSKCQCPRCKVLTSVDEFKKGLM